MAKRVLMVATVPSMIGQFNINNIRILLDMGYQVDVAADFNDVSVWPIERIQQFKDDMKALNVKWIQLDFSRSPLKAMKHIKSYKETVKLIKDNGYSFIHTHTPIASAIVRLAAHKTKTRVIYTAHGFHFYDGAPLKSWLFFYPLEKWLSRYTDVLITINKEDYALAKKRFRAKKVEYVPGVGIDTSKFGGICVDKEKKRAELQIPSNATVLLSVGELNENKNHKTAIRAITGLQQENIYYIIVGRGEKKNELEELIESLGLADHVKLLGFRNDVGGLCEASDAFIFPSYREGLSVSLMEAMASSLPCVVSKVRGNIDLIDEKGGALFDPHSVVECRNAIRKVLESDRERMGANNKEKIKKFDVSTVINKMNDEYMFGGGYCHIERLMNREKKRCELNCDDSVVLLSVGELNVRKNHKVVIKALAEMEKKENPAEMERIGIQYYIVGQGSLKEELEVLIEKSGLTDIVHLFGYCTDMTELYTAADIFVFPSLQEGLPVALMEAMASGLPCVVSRIRGNTDLIEDDRVLFDPNDVEGCRKIIQEILDVDGQEIRRKNKTVIEKFELTKIMIRMKKIYTNIQ